MMTTNRRRSRPRRSEIGPRRGRLGEAQKAWLIACLSGEEVDDDPPGPDDVAQPDATTAAPRRRTAPTDRRRPPPRHGAGRRLRDRLAQDADAARRFPNAARSAASRRAWPGPSRPIRPTTRPCRGPGDRETRRKPLQLRPARPRCGVTATVHTLDQLQHYRGPTSAPRPRGERPPSPPRSTAAAAQPESTAPSPRRGQELRELVTSTNSARSRPPSALAAARKAEPRRLVSRAAGRRPGPGPAPPPIVAHAERAKAAREAARRRPRSARRRASCRRDSLDLAERARDAALSEALRTSPEFGRWSPISTTPAPLWRACAVR